jgi:hypothetical protein
LKDQICQKLASASEKACIGGLRQGVGTDDACPAA